MIVSCGRGVFLICDRANRTRCSVPENSTSMLRSMTMRRRFSVPNSNRGVSRGADSIVCVALLAPSVETPSIEPTADGYVILAVGNDGQFARTAEVLGHPEWAKDARFVTNRARVENRAAVDSMIAEALKGDTADAWLTKLKAAGVPCGRINSVAEALAEPQTEARAMVETVEHSTIGALKMLGIPFKFSDTQPSVRRAPPTLGQHTEEILADELGLDATAIEQLRKDKVV